MSTILSTTPPSAESGQTLLMSLYQPSLSSFTNDSLQTGPNPSLGVGVALHRIEPGTGRVVSALGIGAPFMHFAPVHLLEPFLRPKKHARATPKTRLYVKIELINPCPFYGARIFSGLNILKLIGRAQGLTFVDAVLVLLSSLSHQNNTVAHMIAVIFPEGKISPFFKKVASFSTLVDYQAQASRVVEMALALSVGQLPGVPARPYSLSESMPLYIRVAPEIPLFECTHNKLRAELLAVIGVVGANYFMTCTKDGKEKLVVNLADRVMSLLPRGRGTYAERVKAILELKMPAAELGQKVQKAGISTHRMDKPQDPLLDIIMEILYRRSDNLTLVEQSLFFTVEMAVCDLEFLVDTE